MARRVVGGIASYWIYQHLGNLSPRELDENELYARVRGNQDAERGAASTGRTGSTSTGAGTRWSFCRDFGRTRAIFIDSRAARVLEEERRAIVDDEEWDWIVEHTEGDFDHLLIGTTVPCLLSPALPPPRGLERAALRRRLGRPGRLGEREAAPRSRLRPLGRLRDSFATPARPARRGRLRQARQGAGLDRRPLRRRPPRLPRARSPSTPEAPACGAPVYQAVCSPYRNPLDEKERRVVRAGLRHAASAPSRAPAGPAAGAPDPGIRWRTLDGPYFDNQVATLRLDGREALDAARQDRPRRGGRATRSKKTF